MITRRTLLAQGAATAALAAAGPLVAEVRLGSATLTTVSDGHLTLPGEFILGPMPQDELKPILEEFGVDPKVLTPECNVTLFRDGERTVLFDVGAGPDFQSTAGRLAENLDAAGVAFEDVTHVVFTHAHPDHIWGLLDEFDEPLFPDATYMMGRAEWDYWWDPETVNTIGEARAAFAVGARRRMEVIEDTVVRFDPGAEILPGIASVASFGHTPGHMAFELRNGGESALVVGDAIGNHHVAFARPDWPSGSDQDMETAIKARLMLLDRLASEKMPVIGFHLPGGGIGRVERIAEKSYRFIGDGQ